MSIGVGQGSPGEGPAQIIGLSRIGQGADSGLSQGTEYRNPKLHMTRAESDGILLCISPEIVDIY